MSLIGVALVTKCIISYSQRRLRKGCISCLYSSKRRFICSKTECFSFKSTYVSVLYAQSYGWILARCVSNYTQRTLRSGCIIHFYSSKRSFSPPFITNKTERFSIKRGCAMQVENGKTHRQLKPKKSKGRLY